jgi:hypothetical protein
MRPSMQMSARRPMPIGTALSGTVLSRTVLSRTACLISAWLLLGIGGAVTAAEVPPPPTSAAAAAEVKAPEAKKRPLPIHRKVEFLSAILLWLAVLLVGLALLVMVMIWATRLRRSVRRRPPAPSVPDPFWYLKPRPSAVTQGDQADPLKEKETGHDSDGRSPP